MKKRIVCMICMMTMVFSAGCSNKYSDPGIDTEEAEKPEWSGAVSVSREPEPDSYVVETNYTGDVPAQLYDYPFGRTDNYIMNRDMDIDSNVVDQLEASVDDFIKTMLGTGYRSIQGDIDSYNAKVSSVCSPITTAYTTEGSPHNIQEYTPGLADWFITNHVVIETEFTSDHSLVYSDISTFMRGELDFTIYECDDMGLLSEQLKCFFPDVEEFQIGETYSFIVDASVGLSGDDYIVFDIITIAKFKN